MATKSWIRRARLVAVWLVGLYLARMYVRNGWAKFDPDGFWSAPFERWGYPVWLRVTVGAVELVGGAVLVVPWVATYGAIAVAGVMLGAFATRVMDGGFDDAAWIGIFIAALLWVAYEWRDWRVGTYARAVDVTRRSEGQG